MKIDSIPEILEYLKQQAKLRSLENDEAGILLEAKRNIQNSVEELTNNS